LILLWHHELSRDWHAEIEWKHTSDLTGKTWYAVLLVVPVVVSVLVLALPGAALYWYCFAILNTHSVYATPVLACYAPDSCMHLLLLGNT
jgi:hypothetical protein